MPSNRREQRYDDLSYDALNRLTQKSYSDSTPTATFGYDYVGAGASNAIGRMESYQTTSGGSTKTIATLSFDAMGRTTYSGQWNSVAGITHGVGATYDLAGNLGSITYPSGRIVTYTYNAAMQPTQVQFSSLNGTTVGYNYLSSASYSPPGGPTSLTLGSGVVDANTYNNRLQLASRSVTNGSTSYLNLSYGYVSSGNNGSITSITDSVDSTRSQTFTYDTLNRIATAASSTHATSPSHCYGESFTIDRYGNLTGIGSISSSYTGCTQDNLGVSISASTNRITSSGYSYDSNGNMTNDGSNTLVYDAENRVVSENSGSTTYMHNAASQRVDKVSGSGNTHYVYFGGKVIAEYDNGGGVEAEYVYAGDKLLGTMGEAPNGGFESGTSGWSPWTVGGSTTVVTDVTKAHTGSKYVQISVPGGGSDDGGIMVANFVPVTPGEQIAFGGWTYVESGSGYYGWMLITSDSSYNPVSWIGPSAWTNSASWTYQSGIYTVPSGVAYVRLYLEVYHPSASTVVRVDDGFVSAGTQYFHQDQLGSTRVITDSTGSKIGEQGHFPFGKSWYAPNTTTKWAFTGYERDSESGNDNALARYDASRLGRFLSPDPLGGDISNPQSLNRYAYVWNNPLNLVDPSGLTPEFGDPGFCTADQQTCGGLGGGGWNEQSPIFGGRPPTIPNWSGIPLPGPGSGGSDPMSMIIDNWHNGPNGQPVGDNNGEQLCMFKLGDACFAFEYWSSDSHLWGRSRPLEVPTNNGTSSIPVSVGYTINGIVSPFFLYGLGLAGTYTKIPALNLTCAGGGLGASAGHNFSFGPTVVSTENAKSILSGWSFSAGYNSTPLSGLGGSVNSNGAASGNTFGIPGAAATLTWSKCWGG